MGITVLKFTQLVEDLNRTAVAAWNNRDLESFVALYTEDVTIVTTRELSHGREAILEAYTKEYPDRSQMGIISAEILELRFPPEMKNDRSNLVSMAVAIVFWSIQKDAKDMILSKGFSSITLFLQEDGSVLIAQDITTA